MRKAGKIALGCLGAPVALVLLLVMLALGFRAAGVPDPKLVSTELGQALPGHSATEARGSADREAAAGTADAGAAAPSAPGTAGQAANDGAPQTVLEHRTDRQSEREVSQPLGTGKPVRVVLDMEEGMFEVVPGPAEAGIQVKADYDEATYELSQKYAAEKDGTPVYQLRFKSRIPFMRRLMQHGHFDDSDMAENRIRVQLPVDTPMELVVALSKSQSDVDLSGLALHDGICRLGMGEYRVVVDTPNPIPMEAFIVEAHMGQVRLDGLARLRAGRLVTRGAMGEMRVDLGGALRNETKLDARMKMGELRLNLPENARWEFARGGASAGLGEVTGSTQNPGHPDPEAPMLRVDAGVFMGELRLQSYPADLQAEALSGSGGR